MKEARGLTQCIVLSVYRGLNDGIYCFSAEAKPQAKALADNLAKAFQAEEGDSYVQIVRVQPDSGKMGDIIYCIPTRDRAEQDNQERRFEQG